jgi:hypothetical protein
MKLLLTLSMFFALAAGLSAQPALNCNTAAPDPTSFTLIIEQSPGAPTFIIASPLACTVEAIKFTVTYTDAGGTPHQITQTVDRTLYYAAYMMPGPTPTNLTVSAVALVSSGQPVTVTYPQN